ncbi:MAG: TIGR00730 family Rossman fold protein [Candidatus Tumulicola sp.]
MPRICVFLGSSFGNGDEYLRLTEECARAIVHAGYGIVYGGGRIGLMGALADAALAAGGEVIGVIPESLQRREVAHQGLSDLHIVAGMHERKALMASLSDAFVTLPGGIGTLDEFFDILSWSILGLHAKPIGLLNYLGFFDPLLAQLDHMVAEGFIKPELRELLISATTVRELLAATSSNR